MSAVDWTSLKRRSSVSRAAIEEAVLGFIADFIAVNEIERHCDI
jgi:hypothetical protein